MNIAAFRATYADWKLIKTRSVIQVVFEVPLADHDAAYAALGGMPDPATERWFGIARMKEAPSRETSPVAQPRPAETTDKPRSGGGKKSPAQMAGICSNDPVFWKYLEERHDIICRNSDQAADYIREYCGVMSRSSIVPNTEAANIWGDLHGRFVAWRLVA